MCWVSLTPDQPPARQGVVQSHLLMHVLAELTPNLLPVLPRLHLWLHADDAISPPPVRHRRGAGWMPPPESPSCSPVLAASKALPAVSGTLDLGPLLLPWDSPLRKSSEVCCSVMLVRGCTEVAQQWCACMVCLKATKLQHP